MTENNGIVLLNEAEAKKSASAVCVLGMPRGGTTMTARLLQAAGVFMGADLPVTAEDPEFAQLLREQRPDHAAFNDLVQRRIATHSLWGFKAPFRNHWNLLSNIENIRFVVVFRDILSVANRNRITVNADILASMQANITLQRSIIDFISTQKSPFLLFSYEKALIFPTEVVVSFLQFLGIETRTELVKKMVEIIKPNEQNYVESQDPNRLKTQFHVDILASDRIAGWARQSNNAQVTLAIEINGKLASTKKAILARKDLANKFGGEGRFGFDIRLPTEHHITPGSDILIKNANNGMILFKK